MKGRPAWAALGLLALVLAAYANHFQNGFHFDDTHAIVDNVFVRDLRYIPRYFADATTFSVLPLNQSYRPILQTTFAIDYWIGGGYAPAAFQTDTFIWYLLLLAATLALFMHVTRSAWTALAAVAIFALHPVSAETVNYIVQRGDLLSTLGVIVALDVYIRWPKQRHRGWYLIPFACAVLVKPPALIFPVLLAAYIFLFETRPRMLLRSIAPSLAAAIALAWWTAYMTPSTTTTGASAPVRYLWTQPFVALRYAGKFFAPFGLSADNDWALVSGPSDPRVWIGMAFVAALLVAAWQLRRRDETRPIAFGLVWFVAALLPTSLTPLAEVANDHRMFFPFIGLALAVSVGVSRLLTRTIAASARNAVATAIVAAALVAGGVGVHARNEVWRTDETLWRDVTEKSPNNGRGWMNYGVALMGRGDYADAVTALERAQPLTPRYNLVEVNLGVALGNLGRRGDAERHFLRAIALEPLDWRSHVHFATWLASIHRGPEALAHARIARELNPSDPAAAKLEPPLLTYDRTPEYFLARSLAEYQMGRFRECIASANRALDLRPSYAEAFNNLAAAHIALHEWDAGIVAAQQALRLAPSLTVARDNLNYALKQRLGR